MRKIKLKNPDCYIDNMVEYFNDLLGIAAKGGRKKPGKYPDIEDSFLGSVCGACWALADAERMGARCGACPLSLDYTGVFCGDRTRQIPKNDYEFATPKQIFARVQWMADQVNEHVESDWTIYLEDA